MNTRSLLIWVVYDHPADFPNHFIARLWDGETPTSYILQTDKLEAIRDVLSKSGHVPLCRFEDDDPKIIETWI